MRASLLTMSADSISKALKQVNERITASLNSRIQVCNYYKSLKLYFVYALKQNANCVQRVRLVAVSKTKPIQSILEAYACGQRHFGENYINELLEKSNDAQITENCPEIKWHFIGRIQSNKINKLLSVPNLFVVETVSSENVAESLNRSLEKMNQNQENEKLKVMVQINTSDEQNKNGVQPKQASSLVQFILEKCSRLQFTGIMTIGALDRNPSDGPNPDFQRLVECKSEIMQRLQLKDEMELSMGMSNDFEEAITLGSTNVRIGSTIFGVRDYH
ncbi:hypothetical protein B4U80_06015 [Leptotrombidium deliense]|uniref:Pyridoxal phosphate homeostasis protein n=1 Tax=Leptotrombidium deliense TaxID=299467 RepID=A0A443SJG9_9ACAR|nr:hypothetical protein B4U80_06015 [Leptotrombidium deliense]